jgi:hypothetical protein
MKYLPTSAVSFFLVALLLSCNSIVPEKRAVDVPKISTKSADTYLDGIKSAASAVSILNSALSLVTAGSSETETTGNPLSAIALMLRDLKSPAVSTVGSESTLSATGAFGSGCSRRPSGLFAVTAWFSEEGAKPLQRIELLPQDVINDPYKIIEQDVEQSMHRINIQEITRLFEVECLDGKPALAVVEGREAQFWYDQPSILTVNAASMVIRKNGVKIDLDLRVSINEKTGVLVDAYIGGRTFDEAKGNLISTFQWKIDQVRAEARKLGLPNLI